MRESNGRYTEPATAPLETTWHDAQCQRSITYTVRWWIDPDRVARHGIQDFAPSAPEYCCEETDQTEGPFDRECFDFDAAGP